MTRNTRLVVALAASALVIAALPAAGMAGKGGKPGGGGAGGGTGGGTVTLKALYTHTGGPVYGDRVTFTVSTSATKPFVRLRCYQGSTLVYELTHGFFPDYPWAQVYTLGSSWWTGGSASCRADLVVYSNSKTSVLGTTSFTVAG